MASLWLTVTDPVALSILPIGCGCPDAEPACAQAVPARRPLADRVKPTNRATARVRIARSRLQGTRIRGLVYSIEYAGCNGIARESWPQVTASAPRFGPYARRSRSSCGRGIAGATNQSPSRRDAVR